MPDKNIEPRPGTSTLKFLCKRVAYALATLIVLPMALPELVLQRLFRRDVCFRAQAQLLSLLPGKFGVHLRGAYYHLMLPRCPLGTGFQFGTVINPYAEIGERVCSGEYAHIGVATIGDDCLISQGAQILSGKFSHNITEPGVPFNQQSVKSTRIHIGRNCWIGTNAVVMADVGENSVVGAGAVITRAFPGNKILLGNPARPVASTSEMQSTDHLAPNKAAATSPEIRSDVSESTNGKIIEKVGSPS